MSEPKIRFKNDDGSNFSDWKEEVFGSFVDTISIKTSDKKKYPLYSLTIENGLVPKSERYDREHLVTKEGDVYKIVPPNAFVYNPMNLRFGAVKANHSGMSVSVSGYYDVFTMGTEETIPFWENYLVSDRMLNWYNVIATGSLVEKRRVHYSQFLEITKKLPCEEEQKRISYFLVAVDEVIKQSELEVNALLEQKEGVIQKIFSKKVRFKKEDGSLFPEWKNVKIKDVFEKVGEPVSVQKDESYREIGIRSHGKGLFHKEEITGIELGNKRVFWIEPDCFVVNIVFAWERAVAKTTQNEKGMIASHRFPMYKPIKNSIDVDYAVQFFTTKRGQQVLILASPGGAGRNKTLGQKEFLDSTITLPCIEEQKKIAEVISDMDTAIYLAKQELEKWKLLKKGLMQQMFI